MLLRAQECWKLMDNEDTIRSIYRPSETPAPRKNQAAMRATQKKKAWLEQLEDEDYQHDPIF